MHSANGMKRCTSLLAAIASACAIVALDAARPHYGGTLRMQTRATIRSIDPAAAIADADRPVGARVASLVFDTLTAADATGGVRPALATAWDSDRRRIVWRFTLRPGVSLHGGATLQPWHVVTALRSANPRWKIATDGDVVIIELDQANPDLPWELTNVRNAIAVHTDSGELTGSGPFRVDRADPKRIVVRAHDGYWGGRPFVDAVQIDTGVAAADVLTNFEAGRTDIAPVLPTDIRRITQRELRIVASRPLTTYALVFEAQRSGADALAIRRTIASAINRSALQRVVLQDQGEVATALLPVWLSGYRLAATAAVAATPRAAILALPAAQRTLTLRVDSGDTLGQAIADRIAVDAREAGVTVSLQAPVGLAPRPDVRLVAIRFEATTPDRSLAAAIGAIGARSIALVTNETAPPAGAPVDAVYRMERALLDRFVIVPVVHVPDVYAIADRVEGWSGEPIAAGGAWNLANLWLRTGQPQRR